MNFDFAQYIGKTVTVTLADKGTITGKVLGVTEFGALIQGTTIGQGVGRLYPWSRIDHLDIPNVAEAQARVA